MSMSKTIFRELLDKEASPALGCTEPMMFALAGAITRKHAPGKVLRVDMVGCGLMVTGVQAVGIPNTGGKTGAFLASAVGIVNGDAEACKEVLHNIRPEDVVAAEELIQNAEFTLDMDNSTGKRRMNTLQQLSLRMNIIRGHIWKRTAKCLLTIANPQVKC